MKHVSYSVIVATALAACGTVATEDPPDASTSSATTTPGATGAMTNTGDETSMPPGGMSTAAESGSSSDGASESTAAATTDPDVFFDLGAVPDAPEGDCQQAVDIVFVMDVSTTMTGFIQELSDEILAVDAAIAEMEFSQPPHYGLAVFVDDAQLINGGVPYLDAMTLQADFDMWAAFTSTNQQVGGGNSNSTWTENSLDALYLAADEFQWRPADSTIRMVIHTTDDTFWDGPTIGNDVMIEHGYAETVQALQDAQARVYSFADSIGGSCACLDVTPGWSTPYDGMTPVPEATDGEVYDINQVLDGTVALADAINDAVEESLCDPYTPVG